MFLGLPQSIGTRTRALLEEMGVPKSSGSARPLQAGS